jgi:hypothetical protein
LHSSLRRVTSPTNAATPRTGRSTPIPAKGGGPIRSSEAPFETVEVRREGDRWNWCYKNARADIELRSNDTFATAEEALRSAATAYPSLEPIVVTAGDETGQDELPRGPEIRRLASVLVAAGVVAGLVWWRRRIPPPD